ncbi:MAG: hypothetical protein ABIC95_01235 [archaeon]
MSAKESRCFDPIIWAITDPIIVMPGYTDMSVPGKVMERIRIERLILATRQENMASEAETMRYISTATLRAPIGRDWTDIFMYLKRKYIQTLKMDPPDFLDYQIILNEMQESDLKGLREWIYKRSFEEVKRRSKMP